MQFLPPPNNGTYIANNYIGTGSERFNSDQYDGRADYKYSQKLDFFGRYTLADFDKYAPGAFGDEAGGLALNGINFAGSAHTRTQSLALGATYALSRTEIPDFGCG